MYKTPIHFINQITIFTKTTPRLTKDTIYTKENCYIRKK